VARRIPGSSADRVLINQQPSFLHSYGNDHHRRCSHLSSAANITEGLRDFIDTAGATLTFSVTMNE
jgi:hypothetical protein